MNLVTTAKALVFISYVKFCLFVTIDVIVRTFFLFFFYRAKRGISSGESNASFNLRIAIKG